MSYPEQHDLPDSAKLSKALAALVEANSTSLAEQLQLLHICHLSMLGYASAEAPPHPMDPLLPKALRILADAIETGVQQLEVSVWGP